MDIEEDQSRHASNETLMRFSIYWPYLIAYFSQNTMNCLITENSRHYAKHDQNEKITAPCFSILVCFEFWKEKSMPAFLDLC